jgi:TolB-like protein
LLILIAGGGGWYYFFAVRPAPLSVKPTQAAHFSVVVLPFTNLSGDPSQDYFADGVTENLTTELSRIKDSFVIARNTAFTYKGKSVDAKEIGKELGVRYVLEGSVQRGQNMVRVNAQLIDAESGAHIWADRFEADVADLFKLQDQVVAQLANALRYELGMAEAAKAAAVQIPDAIDLAMRGWAVMPSSLPSKDQVDTARPLFEQALKIDPNNSEALAGKANVTLFEYIYAPKVDIDYDAAILGLVDSPSRSTATISMPIGPRANTWRFPADPTTRCAPSTPVLRLIRTPLGC